ncbi:MAG: hypothetical protein ABL959_20990, partial [Pyrinomonadaceae bacterium]
KNRPSEAVVYALQSTTVISRLEDIDEITSDIVLVSTQDGCIRDAATAIGLKMRRGAAIFHTSGACDSSIFSELGERGFSIGSIHPLVSISRPEMGPERFRGAFFCVEGDANVLSRT